MIRLVKTLNLKSDQELIDKYCEIHRNIWPEIRNGIKEAGISNMEIYLKDNQAVMIVEMDDSLDPEEVFSRLALMPRQQEWEEFVSQFQECNENDTSAAKWKPMEQVFHLNPKTK